MTNAHKENALNILRSMNDAGMTIEDLILAIEALDLERLKELTIQERIMDILNDMQMRVNSLGYYYVRSAIQLVYQNPKMMKKIMNVYSAVAEEHGTTTIRVERSIRRAIETTWNYGDVDALKKYFASAINSDSNKPTNSEFIATIVYYLRREDMR